MIDEWTKVINWQELRSCERVTREREWRVVNDIIPCQLIQLITNLTRLL